MEGLKGLHPLDSEQNKTIDKWRLGPIGSIYTMHGKPNSLPQSPSTIVYIKLEYEVTCYSFIVFLLA